MATQPRPNYIKDPNAVLDYSFDWSSWLATGETISSSTMAATGGITVGTGTNGANAPSNTATYAVVWLIGGTSGSVYNITNLIVTNQGRTDERTITIRVEDR